MSKYVTHADKENGWKHNGKAYLQVDGTSLTLVHKDGKREAGGAGWNMGHVVEYVADGLWKFISEGEALALVKPKYPERFFITINDVSSKPDIAYVEINGEGGVCFYKNGSGSIRSFSTRAEMIRWVEDNRWRVVTEEYAKALVEVKSYSYGDLLTDAPLGTYANLDMYPSLPKMHVVKEGNQRVVLWLDFSKQASVADNSWHKYRFVKVNNVELNMTWK